MDLREERAPGVSTVSRMQEFLRWYARERLDSRLMDERRSMPLSLVPEFGAAGLLGLQVPEMYQGQELSHTDTIRVMTQLGSIDANLMVFTAVHNTLGIPPIQQFAPEAAKKEILPLLAQGRNLVTSAISEPGMGSHVRGITARAFKDVDGSYVLNGEKKWISLGGDAEWINVFAQLHDERGQELGITGFLVDTKLPGFKVGPEEVTLGLRSVPQNGIILDNLRLPEDSLLGTEGDGLAAAKMAFMRGRVTLAAGALGAMMRSLELAHRFTQRRNVATGNLAENGRIQQILTECVAATQAVETLVHHITSRLDAGEVVPDAWFFAAKILGCELAWDVVDRCVQLLGARGYLDTNVVGQMFRDYRLFRIFEGATESITVYLGTMFLGSKHKLGDLLDRFDAAPEVRKAGAMIAGLAATVATSAQQRHVLANEVGEVVCWAMLSALTGSERHRGEIHARTAAWCEGRLRERLHTVGSAFELPTTDVLAGHIAGYAASIGDVEQLPRGENHDIDVLIRRR